MISLRRRIAGPRSRRMLMPALLFFAFASLSAAGGGAVAALCLVPATLALDAVRGDDHDPDQERNQDRDQDPGPGPDQDQDNTQGDV